MFDNLSERLERSFKILKGEGKITEINVAETLKDVRKALLDADVNYKVAKTFTDTVKEKALGQNVLTAVKPSQLMVKIVQDVYKRQLTIQYLRLPVKYFPVVWTPMHFISPNASSELPVILKTVVRSLFLLLP